MRTYTEDMTILKNEINTLLDKYSQMDIFNTLVSITENYKNQEYYNNLIEDVILYLQINKNANVIMINSQDKQKEFEEMINTILPDYNEQRKNLFLAL